MAANEPPFFIFKTLECVAIRRNENNSLHSEINYFY